MGLLLQSKSFLSKQFCFNQNFETRSRLPINLYIMDGRFNKYTIISMYTDILFWSRATHIRWMKNNPGGNPEVLLCLFLYLESNQVIILLKVPKGSKKD